MRMNNASPMPTTLKLVLGFFALGLALDLYTVVVDAGSTVTWIRMAVAVGIIAGLVRGSESVRAIVRAFAVLGMLVGAVNVIRVVPYIGSGLDSLVAIALVAGGIAVLGSAFTFWVLGREDVEMWMARRSFGAV
jgi:hypothetical protein